MGTVEWIAAIFAVGILLKAVIILVKPSPLFGVSRRVLANPGIVMALFPILGAAVIYMLLQTLTIVQIFVGMLAGAFLMAVTLYPYADAILKKHMELLTDKSKLLRAFWPPLLVWVALAVWVLYEVWPMLSG